MTGKNTFLFDMLKIIGIYLNFPIVGKGWKRYPLFSFFKKIKIQRTARPAVFTKGYDQIKLLLTA